MAPYTNPCSQITPDEAIARTGGHGPMAGAYGMKHIQYITFKESWDAALDMEQWGMAIRDEDDEFVGADFRDEKTKLLFAYDYDACTTLRVQGADVKVYLYRRDEAAWHQDRRSRHGNEPADRGREGGRASRRSDSGLTSARGSSMY